MQDKVRNTALFHDAPANARDELLNFIDLGLSGLQYNEYFKVGASFLPGGSLKGRPQRHSEAKGTKKLEVSRLPLVKYKVPQRHSEAKGAKKIEVHRIYID